MSHQPKPQEWRYEEFHPSHYKVFIGNREIGFVSSEDEAQWITLEGNAALAAERENVTLATQMVHIESKRANEAEQKVQTIVDALCQIGLLSGSGDRGDDPLTKLEAISIRCERELEKVKDDQS